MSTNPRGLMAQVVIGGAVLAGISMGVLDPLRTAREDAMSQLEKAEMLARHAGEYAQRMPELSRERAEIEAKLSTMRERSEPARDAAALNARMEELAATAGVRLQRTQPREALSALSKDPPRATTDPATSDQPATASVKPDAVLGFTIDATGSYAGMTRFIEGLERNLGYTRVDSVRIAPDSETEDRVRATISTVHFAFSMPKVVAAEVTQ